MKASPSNDNHALHTPLLESKQKSSKFIFVTFGSIVFLMSLVALALTINQSQKSLESIEITPLTNISSWRNLPRGVAQGVSAKSNPSHHEVSYDWTNAMFSWQRTAFHFQPQKNWMNGKCN